jgi:hypothetical protein
MLVKTFQNCMVISDLKDYFKKSAPEKNNSTTVLVKFKDTQMNLFEEKNLILKETSVFVHKKWMTV